MSLSFCEGIHLLPLLGKKAHQFKIPQEGKLPLQVLRGKVQQTKSEVYSPLLRSCPWRSTLNMACLYPWNDAL